MWRHSTPKEFNGGALNLCSLMGRWYRLKPNLLWASQQWRIRFREGCRADPVRADGEQFTADTALLLAYD